MKHLIAEIPGARRVAQALSLVPSGVPEHRRFVLEQLPSDSVGVEIGVHRGDYSAEILRIVQPKLLHLIDPWKHEQADDYKDAWFGGRAGGGQAEMDRRYQAVCRRFATEAKAGRVVVHRGNSTDVLRTFPDGSLDWVYVDGNHLYEYVIADLELAREKLRPGGLIAGDDYGVEGWWHDGVRRAVDEFVAAGHAEVVEIRVDQFILKCTS